MGLEISMGGFGAIATELARAEALLTAGDKKAILMQAAQPIVNQAKQNASSDPRPRSGKLRAAIGAKATGDKVTVGVHRSDWHDEDYYPVYVEFGHGSTPAHPFVRPAFDARSAEAVQIVSDALKAQMN